jgi:hypothetical protein
MKGRLIKTAISFWRSVGFRRIGSSPFFALAASVDHPCLELKAADDYDPPELGLETPLESYQAKLDKKRTQREGLHIADQFKGFNDDEVARLATLRGVADPTWAQLLRLEYGCTCGQCT